MYTIGEFAKNGNISARMLRHYDKLGLLSPAQIDEGNGYRYYDDTQLAVLAQIEKLKRFGFTLSQISELLPLPEEELARQIQKRRIVAYSELNNLRKALRQMEETVIKMEGTTMDKYQIIVMETPAQRIFGLRKTINVAQTHELFQELYQEMEKRGLKRAGVTQQIYLGDENFDYENMDIEAQVEVVGDHPDVQEVPAHTVIATTHIGPYETIRYAYEAISEWMKKEHPSEYEIVGPGIERYLKDEGEVSSPEELETGVLFPIRKLKNQKREP